MSSEDLDPILTVVIPCLNEERTVAGQLEALSRQDWRRPWELVVVDNGCVDGTVGVVEGYRDRLSALRIVEAFERTGAAHALNVGVAAARGRAVVFCDADDEVAKGWLAAMGDALERHDLAACAADAEKLNEPWAREARDLPRDGLSQLWFPPHLTFAGTAGLGVTKRAHERIGGFDESLPALFDVDYCVRAQQLGFELVYVPEALVHYRYRTAWHEIFDQARRYALSGARLQKSLKPADAGFPGGLRWALSGSKPLLRTLASARSRGGRARLAWQLGWQVGRLHGSLRYRVLAV